MVFKLLASFHINVGVCSLTMASKEAGSNAVVVGHKGGALLLGDMCGIVVIVCSWVYVMCARITCKCLDYLGVEGVQQVPAENPQSTGWVVFVPEACQPLGHTCRVTPCHRMPPLESGLQG